MAKIIVIEGADGSGKETQTRLLVNRLEDMGERVVTMSFPRYDSDSSTLVKNYLGGKYGEKADDINPYQASLFFTGDRVASFKEEWEKYVKEDVVIVFDRYTSSNALHQAAKFQFTKDKKAFLDWLYDLEHAKCELPKADLTIFLDMEPVAAEKLREGRENKITGKETQDIHESDSDFLERSYLNGKFCCEYLGWENIKCSSGGEALGVVEISDKILDKVIKGLKIMSLEVV